MVVIELGLTQPPRPEIRESFTDTVIARLVAASMGGSEGGALGAIETASRWWGAGFGLVRPSRPPVLRSRRSRRPYSTR